MHPDRRAAPRPWTAGWYVRSALNAAISAALADPTLGLRGARVLDYGCGSRPFEPWFAAAGARYEGADIDGSPEVAVRADGTLAAADGGYDGVASFQVLEHVWDVDTYLREAHRVLKRDGWLLLSTHGSWLYHPHPGDYRRWTAEGLRREVESRGFRLEGMRPLVGPLAWSTVFRNLAAAHVLGKVPLAGRLLAGLAAVPLNAWAWLEDRITPAAVTANNACVYLGLFRRC